MSTTPAADPEDPRAIALLDYYQAPPDQRQNLVAIDKCGDVIWRATLPTTASTDAFTEMELVKNGVSAFSWSGHRVLIDSDTGETLGDVFAK